MHPASSAGRSDKHVYATLDGIRGVAAALIAIRHAGPLFPGWDFPHSALAVDLFFVISGFVIASAYDRRLAEGLTPIGFMRIRLNRLYPLYLAGLLLGFGAGLLCWMSGTDPRLNAATLAVPLLFGLVLLPSPYGWNGETFPLNTPSWSLFFELAINIVYALAFRFVTTRRLALIAGMAGAVLLILTVRGQSLADGHDWQHFFTGFVRVTYSFAVGLLLFRLPRRIMPSSPLALLILALAAATLAAPGLGAWYPLVAITLWMPALVLLGTMVQPGPLLRRACLLLGSVSYPLYVLHAPAAVILLWSLGALGIAQPGIGIGLAFLAAMLPAALLADRVIGAWGAQLGQALRPAGRERAPTQTSSAA